MLACIWLKYLFFLIDMQYIAYLQKLKDEWGTNLIPESLNPTKKKIPKLFNLRILKDNIFYFS